MSITQNIREEIKKAMIAKDATKLNVLRGLISAFTNELVSKNVADRSEVTDEEAQVLIKRAVKQRKDSIEQFSKGGRADLVSNETAELKILEQFLPQSMSKDEIRKIAMAKKAELGINDKAGLGKFVGVLMKELKGQADGALVKEVVESLF